MIRFAKSYEDLPVFVYGEGYGHVDKDGKETRAVTITIAGVGDNSVSFDASDFDALVEAGRKAIVAAEKMADVDVVASHKWRAEKAKAGAK